MSEARPIPDGASLRARREALGWTQAQVAEAAGLRHAGYVGHVEHDKAKPLMVDYVLGAIEVEEARRAHQARQEATRRERSRLVESMPPSPQWELLRAAIRERAIDWLDEGKGECCDALLEFLPDAEAVALLDDYFQVDDAR